MRRTLKVGVNVFGMRFSARCSSLENARHRIKHSDPFKPPQVIKKHSLHDAASSLHSRVHHAHDIVVMNLRAVVRWIILMYVTVGSRT